MSLLPLPAGHPGSSMPPWLSGRPAGGYGGIGGQMDIRQILEMLAQMRGGAGAPAGAISAPNAQTMGRAGFPAPQAPDRGPPETATLGWRDRLANRILGPEGSEFEGQDRRDLLMQGMLGAYGSLRESRNTRTSGVNRGVDALVAGMSGVRGSVTEVQKRRRMRKFREHMKEGSEELEARLEDPNLAPEERGRLQRELERRYAIGAGYGYIKPEKPAARAARKNPYTKYLPGGKQVQIDPQTGLPIGEPTRRWEGGAGAKPDKPLKTFRDAQTAQKQAAATIMRERGLQNVGGIIYDQNTRQLATTEQIAEMNAEVRRRVAPNLPKATDAEIEKIQRRLSRALGRDATNEEMADELWKRGKRP